MSICLVRLMYTELGGRHSHVSTLTKHPLHHPLYSRASSSPLPHSLEHSLSSPSSFSAPPHGNPHPIQTIISASLQPLSHACMPRKDTSQRVVLTSRSQPIGHPGYQTPHRC